MASYPERAYVDLLIDEILDAQRRAAIYTEMLLWKDLGEGDRYDYQRIRDAELKRLNTRQQKVDKALDELYAALERKAVADG